MATENGTAEVLVKVVERLDKLDGRLDSIDGRLDRLETGQNALKAQVAEVRVAQRSANVRLEAVEGHVDEILEVLDKRGALLLEVHERLPEMDRVVQRLDDHEKRLSERER